MLRIFIRCTLLVLLIFVWLAFMLVTLVADSSYTEPNSHTPRAHNVVWYG